MWVLFGDPSRPEFMLRLDLGGRQVEVVWLDELHRPELIYLFTQPEGFPDDGLFLEQTHLRCYDHDIALPDGEATYNETWSFKPDGTLHGARAARGGPTERTDGQLEPRSAAAPPRAPPSVR